MSAKWRALQHRHRYTYTAVVFPQPYMDSLTQFPPSSDDCSSLRFLSELKHLASLTSTYSQVTHLKNVASSFAQLLSTSHEPVVSLSARFYLELFFFENSMPLHRTLASVLAKSCTHRDVIAGCLKSLFEGYGGSGGEGGRRFCVSRVALSMMGTPKLGYLVEVVEECCVIVALDLVHGLRSVVSETDDGWARPSPLVMEQCQEALSCLYYLLQRFPNKFYEVDECTSGLIPGDLNLLELVLEIIFSIFRSSALSRDCFVAAGVSLCAALQVCLSEDELGCFILAGVFNQVTCYPAGSSESNLSSVTAKIPYKGDLCSELQQFSALCRLCLFRGILTVVPRGLLNTQFVVGKYGLGSNGTVQRSALTILYDGILPELCSYCENPIDSHLNFHALTVMQICLQQIKASLLPDLIDRTKGFDPMPEHMGARLLRIIWNNLEDPLSQTVKQVHLIFDLLLDVCSAIHSGNDGDKTNLSAFKIAQDLLGMGPRCKGRYVPLASLTRRLGAKTILAMKSNILFETTEAYIDDDVCCVATSFLKCFLEHLRDECWSSEGIDKGYEIYRAHCLHPLLCALASGISKLRSNLNTYALPILLQVDVDSIYPMLAFLSIGVGDEAGLVVPELSSLNLTLTIEEKVAVLVSLLKVCRSLALLEGDIDSCERPSRLLERHGIENSTACFCINRMQVKVPVVWLELALTHVDETIRIDAAESIFMNPKISRLPSHLELHLMRRALPLNMRCSSTAFLMKWTSLFKKFFSRVHTALERHMKQGKWGFTAICNRDKSCVENDRKDNMVSQAEDLFQFMKWFSLFLLLSCYPSAPYERKIMAMELILTMMNTWSVVPPLSDNDSLYPYNRGLTLPESTLLLVGSIIDSWDRLRENSFKILLKFPTPLPGICDLHMVKELVSWAKRLVCSPRVRESDAGALTLRLIFRKYVVELGWTILLSTNSMSFQMNPDSSKGEHISYLTTSPVIEYVKSLVDWLSTFVDEGEKNLSEACKSSFVHGALLTLRYTVEELDWNFVVIPSSIEDMRHALGNLLELIRRITSLALWVVAADAWYLPGDANGVIDDDSLLLELPSVIVEPASTTDNEVHTSTLVGDDKSLEQIVMVGCWLAMKEVSLLLATIVRKVPLPSAVCELTSGQESTLTSDTILNLKQLEIIGEHFLEAILKMKHNGAIDKTRAGFTALCNRLLCSNDPRLCQLTESWMEQLMDKTVAKGQTVDDLLRRSAGIPAAFSAFFLSEPEGAPKKLLPQALRWLIDVATKPLFDQTESFGIDDGLCRSSTILINKGNMSVHPCQKNNRLSSSKTREEGVIPTVHALNVIRAAFSDTNLAADTSGFAAEAMIVSIRSFSSPHWEVRNSASLAYTALVRRMLGFLNVHKREYARRALTGLEFFHRYPSLHSFVFNELKLATELLCCKISQSNLATVVHPSLCPVLILLSRLKPSLIASEAGDDLDPFVFMPFIMRCSTQSNLRMRILASRASSGLISNEKLHRVLLTVVSELPSLGNQSEAAQEIQKQCKSTDRSCCANYNAIHGMLLLLIHLLDINCRNLTDVCMIDLILDDLVKVLTKVSWIGRPRHCSCPILNTSFLKVLDHMINIAKTCKTSSAESVICTLLFELSSECLVEASEGSWFYDPTISDLRKQAAVSYFSCVFQSSEDSVSVLLPYGGSRSNNTLERNAEIDIAIVGLEERLVQLLSDASDEVRLAALKWLLRFIESSEAYDIGDDKRGCQITVINKWAKTRIHTTMIELLSQERNHKCSYYILRILSTWNLLEYQKVGNMRAADTVYIGAMTFESSIEFWNQLVSMYEHSRHTKTREALICCLGFCIRHFTALLKSIILCETGKRRIIECAHDLKKCTFLYDCVTCYVCLLKQRGSSSEPVNMRKAAAESMVVSGLLGQAQIIASSVTNSQIPCENLYPCFEQSESVNMLAYQIMDVWFVCIQLLEDEDVVLREKLALDVLKCIQDRSGDSSHATTSVPVPAQVEKVIEFSFEFLSSLFGHWEVYFDYLSRWVLNAASFDLPKGDLVRRVFDKEIDNHHEEKLLICQICCSHLEKLQVSTTWALDVCRQDQFLSFLKSWRSRFCQQFVSFAIGHAGYFGGGAGWIGGIGNHKDAFLPLYGNLLGVYALSKCIFNGKMDSAACLLSDVVELGKSARPYLKNPLICNMYVILVKLHGKEAGSMGDGAIDGLLEGCYSWEGFNPCFLLG